MANYISIQPKDNFKIVEYTGNTTARTISDVGFLPALTWIKNRSSASDGNLFDSTRGAYKSIATNKNAAEYTGSDSVASWISNGFTLGADTSSGGTVNGSGGSYIAFNFKGSSTTAPSGSTVTLYGSQVNAAMGFGIYKYRCSSVGQYINHGLGAKPSFIMAKNLNTSVPAGDTATDWACYSSRIESDLTQCGDFFISINRTTARQDNSGTWVDTVPDATKVTVGTDTKIGGSGNTHIMYVFCNKRGMQKAGSYDGNANADGNFVYLGFKPAWLLIKNAAANAGWTMFNSLSQPANLVNKFLTPDSNEAQQTDSTHVVDFLSNGFKIRANDGELSGDGSRHIYLAFAEEPVVSSNGIPGLAR